MRLITTTYGPRAVAKLASVVAESKSGDPLAPVTVVVPRNYVGVAARRALGRSVVAGQQPGVAAVQFLTPYRLAELLGGPRLAAAGRRPVSTAVLAAAVRGVLAEAPGVFAAVVDHPATERSLVAAHRELSELGPDALDRLAAQSSRAADVVRVHRMVWGRLHRHWYVETDLADAARDVIAVDGSSLATFGPMVWYLHERLLPSAGRLMRSVADVVPVTVLAALTGSPDADEGVVGSLERLGLHVPTALPSAPDSSNVSVISASDADEEVRAVVREIVLAARRGVSLDAMAVLHPGGEPYRRIVHEQLEAADIPMNGTTPRTLAESLVGRTLLGLLALVDRDFRRLDIMALLASSPLRWRGRPVPAAAWERLSRAAGVVGGADEFAARLARHAGDLRAKAEIESDERDADEHRVARLQAEVARVEDLAAFVADLVRDVTHGGGETWRERARWAGRLLDRYLVAPDQRWPAIEVAAAEKIQASLDRLAVLDAVESAPTSAVFRRTLALELDAALGRVGHLGSGLFVASVHDAVGVDFEHIFVVGLAEGIYPGRVRDDSLLPDRERSVAGGDLAVASTRSADEHRHLLAVAAAANSVTLTWPRGDLRRNNERMPSRWLEELVGTALTAGDAPVRHVPSHVGGLLVGDFPPTQHEYDLRWLLDDVRRGLRADDNPVMTDRPALARSVALVRARQSRALTRFDGAIGARRELDPTAPGAVVSATRLEAWVACPFAYFVHYVLGVQPVEEVDEQLEVSALDKGSLVHAVLDEFYREVLELPDADRPAPTVPWSAAHHQRLQQVADRHLDHLEARGLAGRAVFWRPERRAIHRQLTAFLRSDDLHRAARGARPYATELSFGLPRAHHGAVVWPLPDGRTLRFRGSADRIDRLGDGTLAVLDYKTGRADKYRVNAEDPDRHGSVLQLPVYGRAARMAMAAPDASVYAAYWFVSDRGRYQQVGYVIDDAVTDRFHEVFGTIADGISAGLFVARPDEPTSFNLWVTCACCDPDGLGTRHRHLDWERKRQAPELGPYLQLVDPELHAVIESRREHGDGVLP